MVIIPDYYRGDVCNVTTVNGQRVCKRSKEDFIKIQTFIKKHTAWDDKLRADWEKSIFPYAIKKGAKSVYAAFEESLMKNLYFLPQPNES